MSGTRVVPRAGNERNPSRQTIFRTRLAALGLGVGAGGGSLQCPFRRVSAGSHGFVTESVGTLSIETALRIRAGSCRRVLVRKRCCQSASSPERVAPEFGPPSLAARASSTGRRLALTELALLFSGQPDSEYSTRRELRLGGRAGNCRRLSSCGERPFASTSKCPSTSLRSPPERSHRSANFRKA